MILVVQIFAPQPHGDGASAYGDCARTAPYPACNSPADCTMAECQPYKARARLEGSSMSRSSNSIRDKDTH